jgi:protein-disulfide isomerase
MTHNASFKDIAASGLAFALIGALAGAAAALHLTRDDEAQSRAIAGLEASLAEIRDGAFVRDTILENPEVVLDALTALERKAMAPTTVPAEMIARAQDEDGAFAYGSETPAVTIVKFSDYNCPYCRAAAPVIKQVAAKNPDVRVVVREFPVITPESADVARVSLALKKQGLALEFYETATRSKDRLTAAAALEIARELGADMDVLEKDRTAPDVIDAIAESLDIGRTLNITGTPTLFINDLMVRGLDSAEALQAMIDQERVEAGAAPDAKTHSQGGQE